ALLRPFGDPLTLEFEQLRFNISGYRRDNLFLQRKEVRQVAIVSLGHDVLIGICADQLRRDPNPMARLADAALDHVKRAELLCAFLDVDLLLALGVEGGITGDDREGTPPSQSRDDVFSDAVCKEFLLRVTTKINEWQHRYCAPVIELTQARRRPRIDVFWPIAGPAGCSPDADGLLNILQLLRAKILKLEI